VWQRPKTMLELTDTLERTTGPLSFCLPQLHLESRDQAQFPVADWRAYLLLSSIDPPETVIAGYVDFLIVRLGYAPIPDILAQTPGYGEHWSDPSWFAQLFDGGEVAASIEDHVQEVGPFHTAVLMQDGFVDPAFRGHLLGPWMLLQILQRMVDEVGGLVALYPHPCERSIVRLVEDQDAFRRKINQYWIDHLGVVPIGGEFLGQATGLTTLGNARDSLESVADVLADVNRLDLRRRRQYGDRPPTCGDVEDL
jgi:hypothetical protein